MYKINYQVIEENIKKLSTNDYIILKSNAYGFGFKEVLKIAIELGYYKFAVIDIDDSIFIRENYPNSRVLLLGVIDKHNFLNYEKYQIEISINDIEELYLLQNYKVYVQIALNTGMNRFGILPKDIKRCLSVIEEVNVKLTGVYSHNATKNKTFIKNQSDAFYYAVKDLKGVDIHFSSSSLVDKEITYQNCRRVGDLIFQNALTVFGKIIKVNCLEKYEYVGYDYSYQVKKNTFVGVVDIGYADGLERNCNGFYVYINNKYYLLIGKACMNYSFVLLNDDFIDVGSTVYFISSRNNIENYKQFFGKCSHEIYLSFLKK